MAFFSLPSFSPLDWPFSVAEGGSSFYSDALLRHQEPIDLYLHSHTHKAGLLLKLFGAYSLRQRRQETAQTDGQRKKDEHHDMGGPLSYVRCVYTLRLPGAQHQGRFWLDDLAGQEYFFTVFFLEKMDGQTFFHASVSLDKARPIISSCTSLTARPAAKVCVSMRKPGGKSIDLPGLAK